MAWQQVIGDTDQLLRRGFFKPQAGPVRPFQPFHYDEGMRLAPQQTVTWSDLARGLSPAAAGQPTPIPQASVAALERVNIEAPYSSGKGRVGDWAGLPFNQVLRPSLEEAYVDLYATLKDVPGFDGLYRALTGRREPTAAA